MLWYFKFLARRPFLLLLFVGVIAISCIIVSLTVKKLPDFSDPTLVKTTVLSLYIYIYILLIPNCSSSHPIGLRSTGHLDRPTTDGVEKSQRGLKSVGLVNRQSRRAMAGTPPHHATASAAKEAQEQKEQAQKQQVETNARETNGRGGRLR